MDAFKYFPVQLNLQVISESRNGMDIPLCLHVLVHLCVRKDHPTTQSLSWILCSHTKTAAPDDCIYGLTKTCSDSPFPSTQIKNVKSWSFNIKISHEVQLQNVFVTTNGCNSWLITFHMVSSQTVWVPIFSFVFIDYLRYIPKFKWNKLCLSKLLKISFLKCWQINFIIFPVYILTTFASFLLLIKFRICMVDQKHGNSFYHWS